MTTRRDLPPLASETHLYGVSNETKVDQFKYQILTADMHLSSSFPFLTFRNTDGFDPGVNYIIRRVSLTLSREHHSKHGQ